MCDASSGYMKDGPKNRLRAQDIHKIVDVFTKRLDVPRYARMVSVEEIEKNDFNLNLPRYIDSQTPEDRQDIEGHLNSGESPAIVFTEQGGKREIKEPVIMDLLHRGTLT
jgi:type I restriction enzyme M protein